MSFSCNIFISTRRMTLIFLLTYSPNSEEHFSYPEYVSKLISHYSTTIWRVEMKLLQEMDENVENRLYQMLKRQFYGLFKSQFFTLFVENFCFKWPQNGGKSFQKHDLGMKNIPQSQGNTSVKKIRVIRRVEMKILQEMDETVENRP